MQSSHDYHMTSIALYSPDDVTKCSPYWFQVVLQTILVAQLFDIRCSRIEVVPRHSGEQAAMCVCVCVCVCVCECVCVLDIIILYKFYVTQTMHCAL